MTFRKFAFGLVILLALIVNSFGDIDGWTSYAGSSSNNSIAVDGPETIDESTLQWIAWQDPTAPEYYIEFEGPTSPAIYKSKVYAYAKVFDDLGSYIKNQIICFDSSTGETIWHTIIDMGQADSWSSPVVDTKNNSVIIGSGYKVFALDASTGEICWSTQLEKSIVNASACLALNMKHARAFITDYDPYGANGKLYCINLDTYDAEQNQYEPGEIVWSVILGQTSGNTPAYKDEIVYVASVTDPDNTWASGNPGGTIHAYDAKATTATQLWKTTDSRFEGFFGGLCVTNEGFIYAANYDFYDAEDNSSLCKIDSENGNIIWVTQTERTTSIPIVVGDMIYICGGIQGFGSRPKLEAFRDKQTHAQKLWETPETITIGGWTHQPVYANGKLYIGAIPANGYFFGPYTDLYILDLTKTPAEADFIIDHFQGCGSSPAVTYDSVYTIGLDGLHKFYQPYLAADTNKDHLVDELDILDIVGNWLWTGPVGIERADIDLDGAINLSDFAILASDWGKN